MNFIHLPNPVSLLLRSLAGDSGGPLIDYKTKTLAGVVSWGSGCGRADFSGVYARVSSMVDWIEGQLCNISSFPPDYCNGAVSSATEILSSSGNDNGGNGANSQQSSSNNASGKPANSQQSSGNPNLPYVSSSISGQPLPMYSPRNNEVNSYPGHAPLVSTNGVTINVYYENRPLYVTWTLAMQEQEGQSLSWRTLYRSIRGTAYSLESETFTNVQQGWYRFHLDDPEAETQSGPYDVSIRWMSVVGPRGDLIWGLPEGSEQERRPSYDVYFQVTEQGNVGYVDAPPQSNGV